jgi:20S proteasome alpha/beta subunit
MSVTAIQRLPNRPSKPYIEPTKARPRIESMTAIIGLRGPRRVVLGADTQISQEGHHKFFETKIFECVGTNWRTAFVYSGLPALAKEAAERTFKRLRKESDVGIRTIRLAYEDTLVELGQRNYEMPLSLIICANTDMTPPHAWVFDQKAFHEAEDFSCYGVGDSSLMRYLGPTLSEPPLDANEQENQAIYLISKAIEHIDHCGGNVKVVVLEENKPLKHLTQEDIKTRLQVMKQREIAALRSIIRR